MEAAKAKHWGCNEVSVHDLISDFGFKDFLCPPHELLPHFHPTLILELFSYPDTRYVPANPLLLHIPLNRSITILDILAAEINNELEAP